MLSDINDSKEVIKNRMLKHALSYWGISNTEDLDPAVKLILEALSSELYHLGNEIKDTQVRILEKVATLLAPDFLTSPTPAHAILHAAPVEPTELLTNTTHFLTQRKISSRKNEVLDTTVDVFFTPVDCVKVFDAEITYLVSGRNLFSYDRQFNKQLVQRGKVNIIENNTVWLGMRTHSKIEDISGLHFCFDWKNLESKLAHPNYQLLPLTKWYINDKPLETAPGIQYSRDKKIDSNDKNIFLDHDLMSQVEMDIKHFYDHKFITIADAHFGQTGEAKQNYPTSFKSVFDESLLQKWSEKLIWIKIVFPEAMQQAFLDEIYIYPNAFPVVNRRVNDLKYRLRGGSNIIPLKTGDIDQFLSVKSLTDDLRLYTSVPYRKSEEEDAGTYTLRNGGVERFDGRNARELISYLLELLRSESAAFSAYGYDFIAMTLKEMNQKIFLMEQKTKGYANDSAEVPNYIIVRPLDRSDMMYAEYWTTLAEAANNLRAGTRLQLGKGVKVKPDTLSLMTTTVGGKNRLRPEERLNAFRYGMMTRNRIITKEDIRNFCFFELGDRISKVEVERGIEISPNSREAFRRTIDVALTALHSDRLKTGDWEVLCEQLKSKLQTRSGMSNHYRISVRE
jgi:hypothetical protein